MKHKPTGISVFINGRDQWRNKAKAHEILEERVNGHFKSKEDNKYNADRKDQLGDSGRSGKTRTYNFMDSRVVDHNLNKKSTQIEKIMKGRFDLLFGE